MVTAQKIFNSLLEGLLSRQKDVIVGRFGIDPSGEPQTLAALGDRYGVTRERIRQIEAAGLNLLKRKINAEPEYGAIFSRGKKHLVDQGGVTRGGAFLEYCQSFVPGITANHLGLLLEASKAFLSFPEDTEYHQFYAVDKNAFRKAAGFIAQWESYLRDKKDHVLKGRYADYFENFVKSKKISPAHADNFMSISKKIGSNPYGNVGLAEWPEINPRTIRDRVYLVMRKKGKPLHFKDISELINTTKLGKRAASPTVHNELIKDSRFVLVGRGIYGLQEHGYEPGTAREVIHRILKKTGALQPKNVILAVQKERFFKPNTILVNLQNKSFFERLSDGTYRVRTS